MSTILNRETLHSQLAKLDMLEDSFIRFKEELDDDLEELKGEVGLYCDLTEVEERLGACSGIQMPEISRERIYEMQKELILARSDNPILSLALRGEQSVLDTFMN